MANVSVISTMKNEAESVTEFLESLLGQSRKPDEILIVDGGSIDGTREVIQRFAGKNALIKMIVVEGANISQGRNVAIQNSEYDIIASADAGCRIHEKWLENIVKPLEKDRTVDVVAGFYLPNSKTILEASVAALAFPRLEKIDPDKFLPSSRSIAFRKDAWKKVGGYPEWLYTAEDTLFNIRLKEAGCKFVFAPDAIVYWRPRASLGGFFKQCYLYAKGDGEAGLFTKNYLKRLAQYLVAFALLVIGVRLRLFWFLLAFFVVIRLAVCCFLAYRSLEKSIAILLIPPLVILKDFAEMLGFLRGALNRIVRPKS